MKKYSMTYSETIKTFFFSNNSNADTSCEAIFILHDRMTWEKNRVSGMVVNNTVLSIHSRYATISH